MSGVLQDVRYALRQLQKKPAFTVVTVLLLGLGIGANTAIFSLINAIMLRTLRVSDPQSLVLLKWKAHRIPETKGSSSYDNCPQGGGPAFAGGAISSDAPLDAQGCSFSFPLFQQVQAERKIFSSVLGFVPSPLTLNFEGRTIGAQSLFVSGSFFPTLGVAPGMGRLLDPADDTEGTAPAMVVSHGFWQRELGGDRSIVGKHVLIGETRFTVAGVTGPEFPELDPGLPCDLWLPLAFRPQVAPHVRKQSPANDLWLELIARLQPGVSVSQAASVMSVAFAASTTTGPDAMFKAADAPQIELSTAAYGLATLRRNFSRSLFTLQVAVGIILLIACANIAGLMLARSVARRRELAMRVALGATGGRITRQLLTESLLLSAMGAMAGILLGYQGSGSLVSFLSHNWTFPLQLDVHPDARVLVFTLLTSVLAGVAFGLTPAFFRGRDGLAPALREVAGGGVTGTAGRRNIFRDALVIFQLALATLLLTGAGLVVRTLANLKTEKIGFDPQNLLVFRLDSTYSSRAAANRTAFHTELQRQLSSLPGVTSVSHSGVLLLSGEGIAGPVFSSDQPGSQARVHVLPISGDFLKTLRIPMLEGRPLSEQDSAAPRRPGAPALVVVNQTLVRRLFGKEDPLGKRFRAGNANGPEHEIVGVVGDGKYGFVRDEIWPTVYTPVGDWDGPLYFEIRTAVDPTVIMSEVRTAVSRFDSNLLVTGMKTQTEQIDQNIYLERLIGNLSSLFALLALTVACIGIYGLLSYQMSWRTQEIGIRIALGGQPAHVLWLVLRQGTVLTVAGILLGAGAALGLTRYLQSFLFGVTPTDPLTITVVAFILITVALLACYIPARRAARIDPMVALRYE